MNTLNLTFELSNADTHEAGAARSLERAVREARFRGADSELIRDLAREHAVILAALARLRKLRRRIADIHPPPRAA